ncbi:protocadherin gamma-A6 isoform X28 [Columba livia]|uniref:protocadherin gamma-A6 isoform X28 n=1 Tax=Columba livia TaxID=8932 RepID=UPI0031B9EE2E
MLLGALRQELPCRVPVKRPEELLVTRQHEILVVLPTTLLWWHSEARLRGAVGCQEGADQALGWEERHPEGPEGHSELAHPAGTAPRTAEQAQPNTDWRFSQTQRPGTSGSQNGEEGGAWPNNQFDTEMLQAMILASANEAADANSTLGGGTGTMGLSARYGPQFTLQHVPDYRQNVYIPGSTATLTNAAGKRDAKSAASSGGNKKKSGKKEKK